MSRSFFKIVFAVSVISLGSAGITGTPRAVDAKEDELIIRALFAEESHEYAKSMGLFLKLYDITGNVEYLIQAAKESLIGKSSGDEMIGRLSKWLDSGKGDKREIRISARMLAALYAKKGDFISADRLCSKYLANSKDPVDLKLASSVKIDMKDFRGASKLLKKAYGLNKDEKILLKEALLLDKYLGDTTEAVKILKKHIDEFPDATVAVYFKLIEIYARQKEFSKVLDLYKKLYIRERQDYFLNKIVRLYAYLKNLDGLIVFLEKYGKKDNQLIYDLYKNQNMYDKAIGFARHMYESKRDPKWIAEQAMMIYEKAAYTKRVTPEVLRKMSGLFENALKLGEKDSLYLNYYGYILIDHDIDIDKGLDLVTRALQQEPTNTYYMDSMAWGLYKKGQCEKAYGIMKRVVAMEGLKIPEVKTHWESIRRCFTINDFGHRESR